MVDLPPRERLSFFRSAVAQRVAGGRLYDAHIAAIARSCGASVIVTENVRHFRSSPGDPLRVLTAAEFLAEAEGGAAYRFGACQLASVFSSPSVYSFGGPPFFESSIAFSMRGVASAVFPASWRRRAFSS